MHPFLNIAIQAARSASRIILRSMDRLEHIQVEEKKRNDVVTEVDRLSEAEIIAHIRKVYPNHAVLGEESGASGSHDICWIIDPLDGTLNFVHGLPHFCISIAVKKKNQTEVACIYDPVTNELFAAARGQGAHVNNRRMRVSNTKKLEYALAGTVFPGIVAPEYLPSYLQTFQNLLPQVADMRCTGSAALDLAYVAAGRLDTFLGVGLNEWDVAAAALMIQEAGGAITDFSGQLDFVTNKKVLAGNFTIHKALLSIIQ